MLQKCITNGRKYWYAGWLVALGLLLLYGFNPRMVTKTKIITDTTGTKSADWSNKLTAGEGAKATLNTDGSIEIAGPFSLDGKGKSEERIETHHRETTTSKPAKAWTIQASVGAMLPRAAIVVGMDYNVGKILIFNVGAGARVEMPFGIWTPNRFGAALTLSF